METNTKIRLIILCGILLEIILFKLFIPWLRKIKFGQVIREEGPKRHYIKSGTPTMGGIVIMLGSVGLYLAFRLMVIKEPIHWGDFLLIISFLGYGLFGFLDDYLIVVRKHNRGIPPKYKFLIQLGLALLIYFSSLNHGLTNSINLFGLTIPLYFGYGIFLLLFYVATTNAVNITDGIDGLAGGLLLLSFGAYAVLAYDTGEMTVFYFCIAIVITLITFLLFNTNPARIFMGNVGAYALGGGLAGVAVLLGMEVLLIVIGSVFVWETLSDLIQIAYFKKTKGKRIFLMSPYHHHLELKGFSEWKIDLILWSVGLISAIIGILLGVKLF